MVRPIFNFLIFPLAAAILVAALAPASSAQGGANGGFDPASLDEVTQAAKQIPLTEDMINRLIESCPGSRWL
jgi:hypothetical protein